MAVKRLEAEHSAATRAALLKAARRLFAEHGYAATATEEVVLRTGGGDADWANARIKARRKGDL
jgi:AcrR family transcriptional regulator